MRKSWKFTAIMGMILVISLAIFLPIYFLVELPSDKPKIDNYIYPNPLWNNGSYTDIFVENDSLVHFGIVKTTKYTDINDVIYCKLDFNNDTFDYNQRYNDNILVNYYQIRIQIDADDKPFIYLYGLDNFGYSFGETITIKNEKWTENTAFLGAPLNCSSISRTAVLDWHFSNSKETIISFIYSPPWIYDNTTPPVITPVIYNSSSKQSIFMHEIFPEIENHYSIAPGDFKIMDSILALT